MRDKEHQDRPSCVHLTKIGRHLHPSARRWQECLAMGDDWVHFRLCTVCVQVGCGDDFTKRHATNPFDASRHSIMRSLGAGEHGARRYVDELSLQKV